MEFICNLQGYYVNPDFDIDEWGCASLWIGKKYGAEYNLCIEECMGNIFNRSAIYKCEYNEDDECWETDFNEFVPYEIDFNDQDWQEKLKEAMIRAVEDWYLNGIACAMEKKEERKKVEEKKVESKRVCEVTIYEWDEARDDYISEDFIMSEEGAKAIQWLMDNYKTGLTCEINRRQNIKILDI